MATRVPRRTISPEEALAVGQFAMFMPARTLVGLNPQPGEYRIDESTPSDLWDRKLKEAQRAPGSMTWNGKPIHGAGLYDQIARDGAIHSPVNVFHATGENIPDVPEGSQVIAHGFHRIAVANDLNPNMEVPVENFAGPTNKDLLHAVHPHRL